MAFASKQTAIEQYAKDNFSAAELVFENMKSPHPELVNEWVRLSIQWGDSFRMSLGDANYRHPGVLFAQVFIREGIGISRGVVLADQLSALFRDQVVSGVNFWVPRVNKLTETKGGWFQVQVMIPFYYDEVN